MFQICAELLLDVVEADDAGRVRQQVAEPEGEQELHVGAREGLVHDVAAPARVGDHLRVADRVTARKTRSHGTTTSSKIATASISSKRDESG